MGEQCFKGALVGYLDVSFMNGQVTESQFLVWRKEQMLEYMGKHYGIKVNGEEKKTEEVSK